MRAQPCFLLRALFAALKSRISSVFWPAAFAALFYVVFASHVVHAVGLNSSLMFLELFEHAAIRECIEPQCSCLVPQGFFSVVVGMPWPERRHFTSTF